MTSTPQTLIENLKTHLQDNLTDYNNDRDGNTDWVFIKTQNFDVQQYPKIHIQELGGPHNRFSVGNTTRSIPNEIQISVFNNLYGEFDIDDDGSLENPEQVMSFIKQKVIEEINGNQSKWRESVECSIESFQTVNNQRLQTSGDDVIGWRIDAELNTVT